MANTNVTLDPQRTFVYKDSFYQISNDGGSNTDTIKFIQDWEFSPSMADFDIDRIDTGVPIFTPKSDILGTFRFVAKNAIDIYETSATPTDDLSVSKWAIQIANGEPVSITFITKITAVKDGLANSGFITLQFTGRIMDVSLDQIRETGVQELEVNGEITAITEVRKTAGSA